MIFGERIRLRAAERSDLPLFVAWLNDPEVTQFLFMSLPLSMASEERWYDNMVQGPQAEQVLVIEINTEDGWKPIGNTSLMGIEWTGRLAEVGIFIGEKSLWNQGYGRETMQLMLKHAFETLNLNRVWLRVYEHNLRGIKAYEHAGFVHEGRLRQAIFSNGRYYDVLVMSVLHSEWRAANQGAANG